MKSINTTAYYSETDDDKVKQVSTVDTSSTAKIWSVKVANKGTATPLPCWDCIRDELIEMGFRTFWPDGITGKLEFVRVQNNILDTFEPEGIKNLFVEEHIDTMKGECKIEDEDGVYHTFPAEQLKELFWRVMGNNFATSQLASLPTLTDEILKDTRQRAYYAFKNCLIEVTATKITPIAYESLEGQCVWRAQIKDHDFVSPKERKASMFEEFLKNVAGHIPKRIEAFRSGLGYLLHNYTPATVTKWVWAIDEVTANKDAPQGRTGKGIFGNAVKQLRSTIVPDGKKYKAGSEFFWQDVTKATQVLWIDDINKEFDFDTMYSSTTEGLRIQRKFKSTLTLTREESPKGLITSNIQLNLRGTSNSDRLHVLTFSNFYSSRLKLGTGQPVKDVHGAEFFSEEWDPDEWARFYVFMIQCVQFYLKSGLQRYDCPSIKKNQLIACTNPEFQEWVTDPDLFDKGRIEDGIPRIDKDLLNSYIAASGDEKMTQRTFNRYLRNYADVNEFIFEKIKTNGTNKIKITQNSTVVP